MVPAVATSSLMHLQRKRKALCEKIQDSLNKHIVKVSSQLFNKQIYHLVGDKYFFLAKQPRYPLIF